MTFLLACAVALAVGTVFGWLLRWGSEPHYSDDPFKDMSIEDYGTGHIPISVRRNMADSPDVYENFNSPDESPYRNE